MQKEVIHLHQQLLKRLLSLYNSHTVEKYTRSDAEAINLTKTTSAISEIIEDAKSNK